MSEDIEPLDPVQRNDFNGLVDHAENNGTSVINPAVLNDYKANVNPKTTLTPEHIPIALNEVNNLKSGNPIAGMSASDASYIKSGMSHDYIGNPYNIRYPLSSTHGTNLEGHLDTTKPSSTIPVPDYNNSDSRLNYAKQFTAKYGPLMHGRGDTPLRINEKPDSGSDTAKNMATQVASKYGLDPATLYSSAMEEGMSGLFPDKTGKVDFSGDEKHPISGYQSFGLDTFADKFPDLVKKGLLPADFASKFVKSVEVPKSGDNSKSVNSANFADTDSALQAKAAMVKDFQNQTEQYAKKNNIPLSDKGKEFFGLVGYNAGTGNMQKMMKEYQTKGYLKNDDFTTKNPGTDWKQVHENISRRLLMADALKKEKLF